MSNNEFRCTIFTLLREREMEEAMLKAEIELKQMEILILKTAFETEIVNMSAQDKIEMIQTLKDVFVEGIESDDKS